MIRLPSASRALIAFPNPILGLTPQALCWRPLRGLKQGDRGSFTLSRVTQGSQSLVLGSTLTAASQLVTSERTFASFHLFTREVAPTACPWTMNHAPPKRIVISRCRTTTGHNQRPTHSPWTATQAR